MHVDDSFGIGSAAFLKDEESVAHNFKCKPRTILINETMTFNGSELYRSNPPLICMRQHEKIGKVRNPTDQKTFANQRAMAQYAGVNTHPDTCAPVQLVARGNDPSTDEDFKALKKDIKHLKDTSTSGLNYIALNLPSTRLLVFTDSSFENAMGNRS